MEVLLLVLIKGKDPWGSMLYLCGEDCFGSIDECERRFRSGLGWRGTDGPEHRGELIDLALAVTLEDIEGPGL